MLLRPHHHRFTIEFMGFGGEFIILILMLLNSVDSDEKFMLVSISRANTDLRYRIGCNCVTAVFLLFTVILIKKEI